VRSLPSVLISALVIFALIVFISGAYLAGRGLTSGTAIHSQGPTTESLKRLNDLATLRVTISDVLVGEDWLHQGAYLIKGDAILAVSLDQAIFPGEGKDVGNRRIRVVLPPPYVLTARVDHERTKARDVRQRYWVISPIFGDPDALRDDSMRQAQRLIYQTAGSKDNIDQARVHAAAVIRNLYRELDWEVDVAWSDQETPLPATDPETK